MIYRKFKELEISAMAFGAMRLPVIDGNDGSIDEDKAEKLVDKAFAAGINYFDTAWGYHMGNSETFLGKALSKYPRNKYYLADKFPGYDITNFGKAEEIFEEQLRRCNTEYFDFYLLHNVNEINIDRYLDDCQYMTVTYLLEQVRKGRIKHLGFSAHGTSEVMSRFLEKYGKYMEFGMIQLNYVDYHFQNTKSKIEVLRKYGIPIWVMEPLRGGMLAKLSEENMEKLEKLRPNVSAVEWAFRYLQSFPDVVTILSGMTEMSQMEEKLAIFDSENPLKGNEIETVHNIASAMVTKDTVPCTSCRYCLTHCPRELDIPAILAGYNEHLFTKGGFLGAFAIQGMKADKRPSNCIGCRACEKVCPQQIKISEAMKDYDEKTLSLRKMFFGEGNL